jgi:hypothetical protein
MNNCFNERLCDILLDNSSFIHSIRIVIHCPSATLFGLIGKHRDSLSLRVIHKWRQ